MISTVLELAGMTCIAAAGFLVFIPLGLLLAGAALVLIGYQLGGSDEHPSA